MQRVNLKVFRGDRSFLVSKQSNKKSFTFVNYYKSKNKFLIYCGILEASRFELDLKTSAINNQSPLDFTAL